jgi:hypothetical protein
MSREQAIAHLQQVADDHAELEVIMAGVTTMAPIPDALPNAMNPPPIPGAAQPQTNQGALPKDPEFGGGQTFRGPK